jgi:hypothetical protein
VFLSGTSAGAAPISFYGPVIQQRYPEAYVVALGDAIAGNRGVNLRPAWEAWGTLDVLSHHDGYEGVTAETLGLDLLFQAAAQEEPRLRLAQINSVGDEAQLAFLRRNGMNDTILLPLLDANESAIRRVAPTYRSFIYGGTDHVILMAPTFYYVEADGKRVRDWVAELAAGHDPGDVRCTVCDRPSFLFTETDLRILQRTNELLSSASFWHQEDDGRCDDDDANGRWSLFCALGRASQEVAGTFSQTAALSEVWLRIIELNPDKDRWVSFRDFNNAPETSFGDIDRASPRAGGC